MASLNQVLLSLIQAMNATNQPAIVGWDEVVTWETGILEELIKAGILVSTAQAKSLECQGCEHCCFMDVIMQRNKIASLSRAFIVCDNTEMQSQTGRIEIPLQGLQQWQCSFQQLVKIIAKLLSIDAKIENRLGQSNIRIGMLKGSKGRRWVSLNTSPLSIEINNHRMPLEEVLFFQDDQLVIDDFRIKEQLNSPSKNKDKKYEPSTSKREESKRKTQIRYQNWDDALLKLKKDKPRMSDRWYAIQIAKMPVAESKDFKTILRRMQQ